MFIIKLLSQYVSGINMSHQENKTVTLHHGKAGRREINQQDATNPMFIIKLLSQYVSGIIVPIIRRTIPCITAYGVLHWLCCLCVKVTVRHSNLHTVHTAYNPAAHNHSQHNQCRTPYAVKHGLDLQVMGIMTPETC